MSAVRVCWVANAYCLNSCGSGPCYRATSTGTTAATAGTAAVPNLDELKKTLERLRGLKPTKWVLMSPEGQVWAEEDPMLLLAVLAARKYGPGDFLR